MSQNEPAPVRTGSGYAGGGVDIQLIPGIVEALERRCAQGLFMFVRELLVDPR